MKEIYLAEYGITLRSIKGHPKYWACLEDGSIWSTHGPGAGRNTTGLGPPRKTYVHRRKSEYPPKRKALRITNSGYYSVGLVINVNGKRAKKWYTVHRLICSVKWGDAPEADSECRHLNGRKLDNRAVNLRWCGSNRNFRDKVKHGSGVKLNGRKVKEIRALLMQGVTQAKIAAMHSISVSNVWMISQGLTWRRPEYIPAGFRQWQREHLGRVQAPDAATGARLDRAARAC